MRDQDQACVVRLVSSKINICRNGIFKRGNRGHGVKISSVNPRVRFIGQPRKKDGAEHVSDDAAPVELASGAVESPVPHETGNEPVTHYIGCPSRHMGELVCHWRKVRAVETSRNGCELEIHRG